MSCGWVLYDGHCALCTGLVSRVERVLRPRGVDFVPLQTPWVRERLGGEPGEGLTEMKVLTGDGLVLGGAEAVVYLARRIWWAWPLWGLSRLPMMTALLQRAYAWIARHRKCLGGTCNRPG